MKSWKKVGIAGLLLGLLAAIGLADNNTLNHGSYYQNATNGAKTDANGNAWVSDASRDRDNFQIVTVCSDSMSNGAGVGSAWANAGGAMSFTAESSAVIPCYNYRRFTLMIRVIPTSAAGGADSAAVVRLAVQIRKHTDATNDSASTFAWTSWGNTSVVATPDSTGNQGVGLSGNGALIQNTERGFTFVSQRGYGALGATRQSTAMSWPNGLAVDLVDSRGQWFWAPYVSVRVRIVGNSAGTAAANCPKVICFLAMGS